MSAARTATASNDDYNILSSYLRNVSNHKTITREDEVELAALIKEGDECALKTLVQANLRLVLKIAYKYKNRHCSFLDLINEGNIGLMYAARKYDPKFGLRFSSYAVWWIKQAISLYLIQHAKGPISIPIRKVLLLQKIQKESEKMRTILHRNPTIEELAHRLKLDPKVIKDTMQVMPEYTGWEDYLDMHAQEGADVERDVDQRLCCGVVRNLLEDLPANERRGMELYYGLNGRASNNFAQIGRELNMSREGARQLVKRSLNKLRAMPRTQTLKAYL